MAWASLMKPTRILAHKLAIQSEILREMMHDAVREIIGQKISDKGISWFGLECKLAIDEKNTPYRMMIQRRCIPEHMSNIEIKEGRKKEYTRERKNFRRRKS